MRLSARGHRDRAEDLAEQAERDLATPANHADSATVLLRVSAKAQLGLLHLSLAETARQDAGTAGS